MKKYAKLIRDIPDFPKPGVIFKDITTLIKNGKAFNEVIDIFYGKTRGKKIDLVLAIESRGFIFGGALAQKLKVGFVPVRKPGKLPWAVEQESYSLEYGQDTLQIHQDAVKKGQRVLIIDDLLATGGTLQATCRLVEKLGGKIAGILVLIELAFLKGKEKLNNYDFYSLIKYDQE